jgi:hypothetical protein
VLTAVARGQHTPSKIGATLGRERGAVTHPLDVLESAGYLQREADILRTRHSVITLTDPVIRFNQLITLPAAPGIEAGQAATAWANARHTYQSNILGPHFEQLALLGEARATVSRRGVKDLERLDHIRALLTDQGHDASRATLALFSLHGFHPDLPALYGTGQVLGGCG